MLGERRGGKNLLLLGSLAGLGLLGTTDLLGTVLALLAELARGLLGLLGEADLLQMKVER